MADKRWTLVASRAFCCALLLCFGANTLGVRADVLQVGGAPGWDLGVNYARWAAANPVYVGDTLLFVYQTDVHNVNLLANTTQAFRACNFAGALRLAPNNASVPAGLQGVSQPVASPGPQNYACQVDGHCQMGLRVAINVLPGPRTRAAPAPAPAGA